MPGCVSPPVPAPDLVCDVRRRDRQDADGEPGNGARHRMPPREQQDADHDRQQPERPVPWPPHVERVCVGDHDQRGTLRREQVTEHEQTGGDSRSQGSKRRTVAPQPDGSGRQCPGCACPRSEERADSRIDLRDVLGAAASLEEDQRCDSDPAGDRRPAGARHPNGSQEAQRERQERRRREASSVRDDQLAELQSLGCPTLGLRRSPQHEIGAGRLDPRAVARDGRERQDEGEERERERERRLGGSNGDAEAQRVPVGRERALAGDDPGGDVELQPVDRLPHLDEGARLGDASQEREGGDARLPTVPLPSSRQSTTSVPSSSTRASCSSSGTSSRSHSRRMCGSRWASASSVTQCAVSMRSSRARASGRSRPRRRRPGLAHRCPSAAARRPD